MLRPNRSKGDDSRDFLKFVGTARGTLPPWWGGEPGDTGKVPLGPSPGGGHSQPLSVTPPGAELSPQTSGNWTKAQEKTYGKNETREPYKKTAFRKRKNMENNLRGFALSKGCGYCQPFSVQIETLGKDLRYEVVVSNVMG